MSPHIFLSYSHTDAQFATRLTRDMERAGYEVWLDRTDIKTGARWDDEIVKGLDASQIFMVLLSESAAASQNVKDEIGYAVDHNKQIVPLLLEPCEVPFRLRRAQYIDFTMLQYQKGLKSVLEILHTAFLEAEHHPKKKERKPMDPATLAAAVTGLLAPALAKLGESALEEAGAGIPGQIGELWNAISNRFRGNAAASGAVGDLARDAQDADNQEALTLQLRKALKADPEFAGLLADLAEEAQGGISNIGDGTIATGGSTAVGKISIGGNLSGNITIGNQNQVGDNNQQQNKS